MQISKTNLSLAKTMIGAITLLAPLAAQATNVQGIWPDEAKGAKLGKPAWVLVIPAERKPDGSLVVWDRTNEWVRQWLVPKATPLGLRTVAIVGDSEDKRVIAATEIDNMRSSSLRQIAQKYKAPAIALTVTGEDGEVVAGWVPGSNATWDYSDKVKDRDAALAVMDSIFSATPSAQTTSSGSTQGVQIIAQRINAQTGLMEYRIRVTSQAIEDALASVKGLSINGRASGDASIIEVSMSRGGEIVQALKEAGLNVF